MIYTQHEEVNIKDSYYYIIRETNYDNHFSYYRVILDKDENRLPCLPCSDNLEELNECIEQKIIKHNPNQSLKKLMKVIIKNEDKEFVDRLSEMNYDEYLEDNGSTIKNPNWNLFQEIINKYAFFY